jgi:hypothetical protein
MTAIEVVRLATIPRNSGELRISIEEMNGVRTVSIRQWIRNEDGSHTPTKQGLTIRAAELLPLGLALKEAWVRLVKGEGAPQGQPSTKTGHVTTHRTTQYQPLRDELTADGHL